MPTYRLIKRSGSPRWYITWTERGRSRRVPTGTEDREQAELTLAALRLERERKPEQKPQEVAIAAVLNDYYDGHASKRPSAEQARIARKHLLDFYGASSVAAVHPSTHDEYEAKRRKEGAGNETISRERSVLRAALMRAHKRGWLREVPHVPSLPKAPPRERFLTRAEAARLLRATKSPHLRLFIRLALYTGARRGAILDLTWDRVDMDNRRIVYPLPGRSETNKRRAVVPFAGALYTALRRARKRRRTKHVIEWDGAGVASIRTAFRLAVAAAGLNLKGQPKVTPHTLRHTAATWMAQAGVPIYDISGMLGQRVTRTTELYAKHQPDFLRTAAWAALRGNTRHLRAKQG